MRRALVAAGIAAALALIAWMAWPERAAAPPAEASRPSTRSTTPPPNRPTIAPSAAVVDAPRPEDPPQPADERAALAERFATFAALDLDYELPPGATREEEDRLMLGRLQRNAAEAQALEDAWRDLAERSDDPRVDALAEIAIGDVKDELRADLDDAPTPSYLTPAQAELFAMGMEDKAWAAGAAAREAWDRAAELAEALGPDPEIEALLAERRAPPE
jgi:hypothetical protein